MNEQNYYILSDWSGNVRKCPAGLNHLFDWEFAQTLTYPEDRFKRPKLFMVEGSRNQTLILNTIQNKSYKVKTNKIKPSQHYNPAITRKVKKTNAYVKTNEIREPVVKEIWLIAEE